MPDPPKNFNVVAINSSAVVLTWSKPTDQDAHGVIRGYQIFYSEVSPSTGERRGEPETNTVSNHFTSSDDDFCLINNLFKKNNNLYSS